MSQVYTRNFLGAGLPADAQLSANTAVWLSISIGLFSGLVLFMLSDAWCDFFTNDPKVVGIVERVVRPFPTHPKASRLTSIMTDTSILCGCSF